MAEKIFAAFMVAACVVLLLRLALGSARRHRLDAAVSRFWRRTRSTAHQLAARPVAERRARRAADAAIRRAKSGSWEGNVFRPSSFGDGDGSNKRGDDKPGEKSRKNLH